MPQSDGLLNDSTASSNPENVSKEDDVSANRSFDDKISAKQKTSEASQEGGEASKSELGVTNNDSKGVEVKEEVVDSVTSAETRQDVNEDVSVKEEEVAERKEEEPPKESGQIVAGEAVSPKKSDGEAPGDKDEPMLSDGEDDPAGDRTDEEEKPKLDQLSSSLSEPGAGNQGKSTIQWITVDTTAIFFLIFLYFQRRAAERRSRQSVAFATRRSRLTGISSLTCLTFTFLTSSTETSQKSRLGSVLNATIPEVIQGNCWSWQEKKYSLLK